MVKKSNGSDVHKDQVLDELKTLVNELMGLAEVGKTLTHRLNLSEVLESIIEQSSQILSRKNCYIYILDDDKKNLRLELSLGNPLKKDSVFKIGEKDIGLCALQKTTLIVRNMANQMSMITDSENLPETFNADKILMPLICRDECLGVIKFSLRKKNQILNQFDLKALQLFCDFSAIAIDNAKTHQKLEGLTILDEHTQLFNPRYLKRILPVEIQRADRYHHDLALIFFDLDNFKTVNDTHGHLVGSALLKELGTLILSQIRSTDLAFRYGGDEFVILMPETDIIGAKKFFTRFKKTLNQFIFLRELNLNICQTASFGIATFPDDGIYAEELMAAADAAMYHIKKNSRDGIFLAKDL